MNFTKIKVFITKCNVLVSFELTRQWPNVTKVKPVLSGHSKIDKTKVLMTNGSLMKVESIAESWNILQ